MTNIGPVGTNMAVVDPDRGGGGVPPNFFIEFLEIMAKIINFTHYFGVK